LRVDVFHSARWPGDAGVVDQHVEAAEPANGRVEKSVHVGQRSDIGSGRPGVGTGFRKCLQRSFVHITDMYPGAIVCEGLGDGQANPRGAGRDHDPQAFHRYVHVKFPCCEAPCAPAFCRW